MWSWDFATYHYESFKFLPFHYFAVPWKIKESKYGTIIKLFLLRIRANSTEMLDGEKICLKLHQLLVVDSHNSSCDCNDKSYFLHVELAKHNFNNLVYVTAWTGRGTLDEFLRRNRCFSHFMQCFVGQNIIGVIGSSQDSINTLTYFSHNSEKTGNVFVNKFIKQTLQIGLDWV